eukprot:350108-Chlamydomonas_euryale.AAC.5
MSWTCKIISKERVAPETRHQRRGTKDEHGLKEKAQPRSKLRTRASPVPPPPTHTHLSPLAFHTHAHSQNSDAPPPFSLLTKAFYFQTNLLLPSEKLLLLYYSIYPPCHACSIATDPGPTTRPSPAAAARRVVPSARRRLREGAGHGRRAALPERCARVTMCAAWKCGIRYAPGAAAVQVQLYGRCCVPAAAAGKVQVVAVPHSLFDLPA